ncbi:hypothetical protein GF373_03610 [bacterium]|nr:hypothetical protein [bacterium]
MKTMVQRFFMFCAVLAVGVVLSTAAMAQEPELPLKWEGKGKAAYIQYGYVESLEFTAQINVDTDGWVTGKFFNDEGEAKIQRFYYGQVVNGVRDLIVVLLDKESNDPTVIILSGKIHDSHFFYGEIHAKPYDKSGEVEKGLNLGDQMAQEIFEGYKPSTLKKALKACKSIGCFVVKGQPK